MTGLNTDTIARDRMYEYEKHREFWQNGLQLIEEVSASLESSLALLEKKYADFDSIYDEAMDRIDELAAIYSGINTIQGREYVLRLKALMREYRNRYSIEGINFNALYYLQARIRELRDKSFIDFPRLQHSPPERETTPRTDEPVLPIKHRWVTFERNGSCFIVPFERLEIIDHHGADLRPDQGMRGFSLYRDGVRLEIRDIFASTTSVKTRPAFFIIVEMEGVSVCYAASNIGKKILSRRDIISPRLRSVPGGGISRGSLRLFGRNHLFIHPNYQARRSG